MTRRRGRNTLNTIYFLMVVMLIGGVVYLYNSSLLERNDPKIDIPDQIAWNMQGPLKLSISDDSGIRYYKVLLTDGKNNIMLDSQTFDNPQIAVQINVNPPKTGLMFERNNAEFIIEANDISKWNFMSGNTSIKRVKVNIDTKKPDVKIVDSSYGINKGGSALVIFKATDENLKSLYIATNYEKKFIPIKFYKEGYYIALIAWPVWHNDLKSAIVAEDSAGNNKIIPLQFHIKQKEYSTSKIQLKDDFLSGKISELYEELQPKKYVTDTIEKFKYINEEERKRNEDLIHNITSKIDENYVDSFAINTLNPLRNGEVVARFGDHRLFYRTDQNVIESESYHLGLDLASIKMASITTTNTSKVVHTAYNGIYGNMAILYHGLGLYTLYGHCTSISTNVGDTVQAGTAFAQTGVTGLALGDHLHFGVLVQGVEVRPEEWMDNQWIRLNVYDVINNSKKSIDTNKI